MRLATIQNGTPDGRLVVVSPNGQYFRDASQIAPTLQHALENWLSCEPQLQQLAETLAQGQGEPLAQETLCAPLPRAWQWLDGSAFSTHGHLMQIAFGQDPIESERPLMYQGLSDKFCGPADDIRLPAVEDGIDFEGEFGVIVDFVPMGK